MLAIFSLLISQVSRTNPLWMLLVSTFLQLSEPSHFRYKFSLQNYAVVIDLSKLKCTCFSLQYWMYVRKFHYWFYRVELTVE